MAFQRYLRTVQDGEAVAASIVNRPSEELLQNTAYLKDLLDAAGAGEAVYARDVTVAAETVVGQAVYFNANTQKFELAIAAAEVGVSGEIMTASTAQVWGIISAKTNATLADLLILGYAEIDLTAALEAGQTLAAGIWYLSRITAGALTQVSLPGSIPVLKSDGAGHVLITPFWSDVAGLHNHSYFKLQALPAGDVTPPAEGEVHVISNADNTVEGWLPADDTIFGGNAPDGAVFGYNISANTALANVWPPVPPEGAVLLGDGRKIPTGTDALAIIDRNGIWWMTDCYAFAPWPTGLDTSVSESAGIGCEDLPPTTLELFFTSFAYLASTALVTSLTTTDSRIVITCQDNATVQSTGPLKLALDLGFSSGPATDVGTTAIKSYDETTSKFAVGQVATGLYAAGSNVTLSGEVSRVQSIGGINRTVHAGAIGVNVSVSLYRELSVELIRLDGVLEEEVDDVMFVGFPAAKLTSIRCRLHIPAELELTAPLLRLTLRVLGTGAGTLPALTITGRSVPASAVVTDLPTTDTGVAITTTETLTGANQYVDVTSDPVAIAAGDDYLFTIARAGNEDTYAYEVGLLRISGVLSAV